MPGWFLVWGDCAAGHTQLEGMPQDGKPSQVSLLISIVTSNERWQVDYRRMANM